MFRSVLAVAALAASVAVSGCATTPDAPMGPPDFTPVPTRAEPRAKLYADCIAQSATTGAYGHAQDPDTDTILFTCTGAPARAFYEGLAARSAAVGSEVVSGGRTYRSTNAVIRNLFGVDYCSTGGGSDFTCVLTLNAGAFLRD